MTGYKGRFRGDIFVMLKCFVNIMGKCTGIGHFYYKIMYILSKIYNHSLRRIAYNHGPAPSSSLCIWGILLCELSSVFPHIARRHAIVLSETVFRKWTSEEADQIPFQWMIDQRQTTGVPHINIHTAP